MPTNLSTWGDINQTYASRFVATNNAAGNFYEQWNEPDLVINGAKIFFNGSASDYVNVYNSGRSGIQSGDPDALSGGPAVAYDVGNYVTGNSFPSNPINFVSIHGYANYSTQLLNLRAAIPERPELPMLLTEYASFSTFGPGTPVNLHQAAAAFFNDIPGLVSFYDTPKVYWAQWVDDSLGMLSTGVSDPDGRTHRKAIYNAYKIYQTMLPVDAVSVSPSSSGNVGAIAASDPDVAGIVLYNNDTVAHAATVNLNNLPFSGGTAQTLLIDQTHASYEDGAPENLSPSDQWTFTGNNTSRNVTIQAQSIAFLRAYDSSSHSLLGNIELGHYIHSYYWYFNRTGNAYSDFDWKTSIARVGEGSQTYDVAQIGNIYDYPVHKFNVTVAKTGPFSNNDSNSLFGLRLDFQNSSSSYDWSVLYHNGLYSTSRTSTLPWGTGSATANNVIYEAGMNTGTSFQVVLANVAPSDWNHKRVILSPIIQNAGGGSQARIMLSPVALVAIAAGGTGGGGFSADQDYSGGSTYSTTQNIDLTATANAGPQSVYQNERWGDFTYTIPNLTPNEHYNVRLTFSENFFNAPQQRLFNVAINGTAVLMNFDIWSAAGAEYTAVAKQFQAQANNSGQIVISFANGSANNAKVDAIEIY